MLARFLLVLGLDFLPSCSKQGELLLWYYKPLWPNIISSYRTGMRRKNICFGLFFYSVIVFFPCHGWSPEILFFVSPFHGSFCCAFLFSSHKIKLTNQNWEVLTLFGKKKDTELHKIVFSYIIFLVSAFHLCYAGAVCYKIRVVYKVQ